MKVKVSLTIEISDDAWAMNYGSAPTRTDVRSYVHNLVSEQLINGVEVATSVRDTS